MAESTVPFDESAAAGRIPLIVGGTGFYLRALFEPLFEEPPVDISRRDAIEAHLGTLSTVELSRWARVLDPERRSYFSRATFADPDGNQWQLQEITERLPGRV